MNWNNKRVERKSIRIDKEEINIEFAKSKELGRWTNRAGELIIILTENIIFSRKFNLTSNKFIVTELLIDYVTMYILEKGLRLFKPENNPNAYAYFSGVVFSQGKEFLRLRFGVRKRLDLYGQRLAYKDYKNKWHIMELINESDRKDYE